MCAMMGSGNTAWAPLASCFTPDCVSRWCSLSLLSERPSTNSSTSVSSLWKITWTTRKNIYEKNIYEKNIYEKNIYIYMRRIYLYIWENNKKQQKKTKQKKMHVNYKQRRSCEQHATLTSYRERSTCRHIVWCCGAIAHAEVQARSWCPCATFAAFFDRDVWVRSAWVRALARPR